MFKNNRKNILFTLFFTIAFLERIVFDLGSNVELITTSMLLAAIYLGRKESLWLTLSILVVTDLIIGNSNIFIFTWTGFLIPAILVSTLFKTLKTKALTKISLATGSGLLSNFFFFFWTNFGVWYLTNMYTKNLNGLLSSYINALPFLKHQLISTLVFVPILFSLVELTLYLNGRFSVEKKIENIFQRALSYRL